MTATSRSFARAGFLLACSLTLGCQSLTPPPRAGLPGPFYAQDAGRPSAPVAVAPARTDLRQVANWPASGSGGGESATPWRAVQQTGSTWTPVQHVGEPALVSAPAVTSQPPALSEAVVGPTLVSLPPRTVPSPGPLAEGMRRPVFHRGPAVVVPPGNAPYETKQVSLPPYRIGPPDILLVESVEGIEEIQPIRGQHLVRPDGTIGLGIYGSVYVNGLTIDQAHEAVSRLIYARAKDPSKVPYERVYKNTSVDVLAYNSQVYYVITDGAGLGQQVVPIPVTGREFVLDALAKVNGLSPVSSKKHIWVARRAGDGVIHQQVMPVDWIGITERGDIKTNYQIMPGDRVFVQSDPVRRFDTNLGKFLSPVERLFGVTLLSSQAINSIRSGTVTGVR